ncbi:MAG: colanic acid biosynthesis glycosyltransferase WcaL [Pleurocapsa sp.]
MRIAFLIDQFPNLSETFILQQITGLIDRGHEVDIFSDRSGNLTKIHPAVEHYQLLQRTYYTAVPSNRFLRVFQSIKIFRQISKTAPKQNLIQYQFKSSEYGEQTVFSKPFYAIFPFLNREPYDIIHCHYGRNGLRAILLKDAGIIKGKIIVSFHGYDMSQYLQRYGKDVYCHLFTQADLLQPISEHWRRKLISLGCNPDKIAVHHMGIDCNKFDFISRSAKSEDKVRLVSIARLVEKKGLEYGIKAVAHLLKTNPHLEYKIVGDGVLKNDLQKLIIELQVQDKIKLLGWRQQEEVTSIIAEADIMLAPSITSDLGDCEGIPVALMEAMAVGLPVISTYHSGIPELVEDGVSGYLVDEREVEQLAEKINLLAQNPELRLKMGLAGRQKVEKEFNIELLNDRLVATYQKLIKEA